MCNMVEGDKGHEPLYIFDFSVLPPTTLSAHDFNHLVRTFRDSLIVAGHISDGT